jgi:hypothetical protein
MIFQFKADRALSSEVKSNITIYLSVAKLIDCQLAKVVDEYQLDSIEIHYTNYGRVPSTSYSWPQQFGFRGRLLVTT